MKNLNEMKNKKVAILGMGIEGVALANFLHDKVGELFLLDKLTFAELSEGDMATELNSLLAKDNVWYKFGKDYLEKMESFDMIFRSPGISLQNPALLSAKEKGVKISSQIKLFFDLCPCKIIGVTGTKGKGTTSSLIFEIVKNNFKKSNPDNSRAYLAGNIGYPAISLIPQINKNDLVVLELSSFQLMDLTKSPHISVITNLLIDHMDYHKSVEEYRSAKFNVLAYQDGSDYAVLNKRDEKEFQLSKRTNAKKLFFSREDRSDAYIEKTNGLHRLILKDFGEICNEENIKLLGVHNLENIAAATLVGRILGVSSEIISYTAKSFNGLPHRLEKIATIGGVDFVNDSFATNPEPTMAAIDAVKGEKILILGGSSKGADFTDLADRIASSNVKAVIAIGDEATKIGNALAAVKYQGQTISGIANMEGIIAESTNISKKGDTVLLSPACASFGMFKNYKDRGEQFRNAVINYVRK